MLIRPEQLQVFEQASQQDFEDRLCTFVRQKMPSTTSALKAEQLRAKVVSHMSVAREFGFRSQSSIAQFVCLAFLPGTPFYEDKYLNAFLRFGGFEPETRMQCVVDQLAKELSRRRKLVSV